jgi:DNA replication protein DnaC
MSNSYKVLISSVKAPRKLVPYNENFYVETLKDLNKEEAFESLYIYNENHKKQLDETGSLAGIQDVVTDKIVFDFDDQSNPEVSLNDARTLTKKLLADGFDSKTILCSFSGNKGIHIEVPLSYTVDRRQFEAIVDAYAGNLPSFDTSVKDQQRVFRLPLSLNKKSGLYKFPLTVESLLDESVTIDQMKEYAKHPDLESSVELIKSVERTQAKFKYKTKKEEVKKLESNSEEKPDFSKNKTGLTDAKYALACGFFEEGERHEAVMILASTYRALGWELENAYRNIKGTIAQRNRRLNRGDWTEAQKEELWTEVSSVYNVNWKGGTYNEESGLLKKTKERYKISSIQANSLSSLTSLKDIYKDFALNIEKNTIKLGVEELDSKVRITTSMLVSLLASPGGGKTHISLSFLNNVSNSGVKSIFFSLDMGVPLVYQRLIQKHTGEKSDVITKHYELNNKKKIAEYESILEKEYKNVKFCFKSGLTVELIREIILNERDTTGEVPKLVVIDYLECIRSQFSDPTASKAYIASSLKDIANEMGICILLLVQPTKFLADPSIEITSQSAIKGSGVIIEASSVILGLYRPGFDPKYPENDKFATVSVLKNRMGELSTTDLSWDGLTGHIRTLTEEEEKDLKALREAIAQQKSEQDSGSGFKKFGSNRNGDVY